jgi:transposase
MAKPLPIIIKESTIELRKELKKAPIHLKPRIQMLLLIKEDKASSKRGLAIAMGVDPNSIQKWRSTYINSGLAGLLEFVRGGKKKSLINSTAHKAIEQKLTNPKEAFTSFVQLQDWISEKFVPGINYHTVNKYVKRHFGAKLKVARKSHILKDEQAVEAFKKNPTAA